MAIQYERQAAQNAFLSLDGRLHALSREMWSRGFGVPLGLSGWVKITLAVLLPFLTLLVTGSLEKAHMVSQMVP